MSLEGQQIGRYRILHLLGSGGMGNVYLAEDAHIEQQVAIKVIRMEEGTNPSAEAARLFQREVRAIVKLDHPHILPLFNYGEELISDITLIYLVMPYRREGSLAAWLRQRDQGQLLPPEDMAYMVHQAAEALQHAHNRHVIHQDVKPSNFLIRSREETPNRPDLLLADFGIARFATATSGVSQSVRGTPTYMAPEQWEGEPVPATDQYALAVMAYELLTGRPPFQGGLGRLMYQHLHVPPAPPSTLNPRLSHEIDTVLLHALAKKPEMRFASITAFATAFQQATQGIRGGDVPALVAPLQVPHSGGDIRAALVVSTAEALSGMTRMVTLPGGRRVTVPVPPGVQDGQTIRLDGQGDPSPDGGSAGALILTVVVKPAEESPLISSVGRSESAVRTLKISSTQPVVSASDAHMMQVPMGGTLSTGAPIVPSQSMQVQQHKTPPLPISGNPPLVSQHGIADRLPHQRYRGRTFALPALFILLVALLSISYFALPFVRGGVSGPHPSQTVLPQLPVGIGVVKAPNGEYIGISDGSFAFDTNRPDGDLKRQASEKLKADDFSSANYLWQQAVAKDTNDAETLIYMENQHVLNSGSPYITIVLGTTVTGGATPITIGRQNLRGVYVAQKEYNAKSKLPRGVQVFLLIANSGSDQSYATLVAQQIVRLAQMDKTIVGVVGWSLSEQALNALGALAPAHLPMISNAGADSLTNISPYFFRVVAPAATQAQIGAGYVEKTLHAKTAALFVDMKEDYSRSLGNVFMKTFMSEGKIIVATEDYTVGKPGTLPKSLQDALSKHPDVIYFAGYPAEAGVVLAHLRPSDPPVMGGNSLYQLQGYSSGARSGLSHLHFTAGAYPDQWDVLGLAARKPPFFADYKLDFDPHNQHSNAPYEYDRPQGGDILFYDAMSTLLYGCSIALTENSSFTGSALQRALTEITGQKTFQGISGAIAFGPDGNPTNKATTILCLDKDKHIKLDWVQGQFLVGETPRTQFPASSVCS